MRRTLLALALIAAAATSVFAQTDQLSNVKGLVDQAKTAFDQLDYENTIKALDSAIGAVEARPTPEAKRMLPEAYDMRARALFGLGKDKDATADLVSLVKVEPGYQLSGQVSPKILAVW